MKRKIKKTIAISLLILTITLTVFGAIQIAPARAEKQFNDEVDVLVLTNRADTKLSAPWISLNLDDRINLERFGPKDDTPAAIRNFNFAEIDVVVVDCYLPAQVADVEWLFKAIWENDIGVIFFGGNYSVDALDVFEPMIPAYFFSDLEAINQTLEEMTAGVTGFSDLPEQSYYKWFNESEPYSILRDQVQVSVSDKEEASGDKLPFSENIAWQSCPLLRERVSTFAEKDKGYTVVEVPNTNEPLLVLGTMKELSETVDSDAQVLFVSTGVAQINETNDDGEDELKDMNKAFSLWPYFNYLMYVSIYYLDLDFDNDKIESYADWPWSPIPHEREATLWMTFVGSLWVFNFVLFFALGKKKKKADELAADGKAVPDDKAEAPAADSETVGDKEKPDESAAPPKSGESETPPAPDEESKAE